MRTLKLIVSETKGALPVLVVATLLPAGTSCSRSTLRTESAAAATSSAGGGPSSTSGSGGAGGAGGEGIGGFTVSSSTTGAGGMGGFQCEPGAFLHDLQVEVPPDGVPASPGAICAVMMSPVASNHAARVTLAKTSPSLELATGFVALDPSLDGLVVGLPTIEVVDALHPEFFGMQVSNVMPMPGGFRFDAAWPPPFEVSPQTWARMTVKTTLTIKCDPAGMDTRIVESLTNIRLCDEETDFAWHSSGELCKACDIIAEMAPSPIVSDKTGDDLPLGRALRLRILILSRIGRTLILLAENDGGPGLSYEWMVSGGELASLAPDIVLWTPPPGIRQALIQAAVSGDEAAAVVSHTYREVA